jgi:amidase
MGFQGRQATSGALLQETSMPANVHYLGLLDVSDRIRRQELSAEAVTQGALDRIERYEGRLNSILMLLADQALADARRADAEIASGLWRGPLHGVPIGVKDLLWTQGLPTTAGMAVLKDFRPDVDATVVARLKRAGAVIIAKLHMTEGATLAHHPSLPRPVNPWSAAHWTGVSSSGSGVAPAAGFCYGAIGTDTGGSIRFPSSANNLTGIKPTWGRVSRHGLIHLSESLDHIGPMARSAEDAAAILQAIAGADPADPTALSAPVPDYLAGRNGGVSGLVVGIDWKFATDGMPDEVVGAVRGAADVLSSLGARVREIVVPWSGDDAARMLALFRAETAVAHAEHFPAKADLYGPWLRKSLEAAGDLDAASVVRANYVRDRFRSQLSAIFGEVDMILTPGIGGRLPTWEEAETGELGALVRFTTPFNAGGVPTISLPGGFTEDGLPVGIQLIGERLSEVTLIRAGVAFQRVTAFHTRRPRLDQAAARVAQSSV